MSDYDQPLQSIIWGLTMLPNVLDEVLSKGVERIIPGDLLVNQISANSLCLGTLGGNSDVAPRWIGELGQLK